MKKVLRICLWSVIGLFVIYTFYFLWQQSQPAPEVYELVVPQKRDIVNNVTATGALEARTQVELKPQVTGIISELKVQAGDYVNIGDVVATIRVIPEMSQLTMAQNEVEAANIAMRETKREADRSQRLFAQGVISREENEQKQTELESARDRVTAAMSQVEVITRGSSARSGGVNTTEVRSSMNGIILNVPVKVGTSVSGSSQFSQGTTIATVADMNDVIFRGNIDETDVAKLHTGMAVSLVPGSMQDVTIPAILDYISPEGILQNGAKMFELKATAQVPEGVEIRSGYSVNASIALEEARQVLSVDETCVEFDGVRPYVYKLVSSADNPEKQEWERISILIGISDGIYVEIKSGITPKDHIRGALKN